MIYIYIYREREREREKQQINKYYVRIPAVINILMLFISTCYNLLMWHQKLTKRFHQIRKYRNLLIRFPNTLVSTEYDGSVNRYNQKIDIKRRARALFCTFWSLDSVPLHSNAHYRAHVLAWVYHSIHSSRKSASAELKFAKYKFSLAGDIREHAAPNI